MKPYNAIEKMLSNLGQTQILRFVDNLSEVQRCALLHDIENIDFQSISKAMTDSKENHSCDYAPIEACDIKDIEKNGSLYKKKGEELIKDGRKLSCI